MILNDGCTVLIVHRRLYDKDIPRFFVGKILAYDAGIAKVYGKTWVRDTFSGDIISKPEFRTKIFSIVSGTLIVYQIPEGVDWEELKFAHKETHLFLTDSKSFKMDLSECYQLPDTKKKTKKT